MFKQYKFHIILSSIITLLPIIFGLIFWNRLPDVMPTHFGADRVADGFGSKAFAVFGLPLLLLLTQFICIFFTLRDQKQRNQSQKALRMVFWIIPLLSLATNGTMYRFALDGNFQLSVVLALPLGAMFLLLGNYLPKVKQNNTLGIKISWTLNNEENWNKTHRFTGKVWVIGGILMLLSLFLPSQVMIWFVICIAVVMMILPIAYSYHIYRQHKKAGIVYASSPRSRTQRIASFVLIALVCVVLIVTMFTGNIHADCDDASLHIKASYWTNLDLDYSKIDTIEYRDDLDVGSRSNGFGSLRLSEGIFQNSEFGSYTLYAYTGAKEYIVLTSDKNTLVIGLKDAEETQELYHTLLEKIAQ